MQCYKQFLLLLLISLKSSKKSLLSELIQGFCLGNMLPVKNLNLHFFCRMIAHRATTYAVLSVDPDRSILVRRSAAARLLRVESATKTNFAQRSTKLLGIMKRQTILYTKIKVCGTFFRNDKCPNFLGTFVSFLGHFIGSISIRKFTSMYIFKYYSLMALVAITLSLQQYLLFSFKYVYI